MTDPGELVSSCASPRCSWTGLYQCARKVRVGNRELVARVCWCLRAGWPRAVRTACRQSLSPSADRLGSRTFRRGPRWAWPCGAATAGAVARAHAPPAGPTCGRDAAHRLPAGDPHPQGPRGASFHPVPDFRGASFSPAQTPPSYPKTPPTPRARPRRPIIPFPAIVAWRTRAIVHDRRLFIIISSSFATCFRLGNDRNKRM